MWTLCAWISQAWGHWYLWSLPLGVQGWADLICKDRNQEGVNPPRWTFWKAGDSLLPGVGIGSVGCLQREAFFGLCNMHFCHSPWKLTKGRAIQRRPRTLSTTQQPRMPCFGALELLSRGHLEWECGNGKRGCSGKAILEKDGDALLTVERTWVRTSERACVVSTVK